MNDIEVSKAKKYSGLSNNPYNRSIYTIVNGQEQEDLYYTSSCEWILNSYINMQGIDSTYTKKINSVYNKISETDATYWLIKNSHTTVQELPENVRKLVEDKINEQEL